MQTLFAGSHWDYFNVMLPHYVTIRFSSVLSYLTFKLHINGN